MKDEQLIKNLIKQGESRQLVFKEFVSKEDVAKTLCAFLNSEGGTVLIGVQDDGKIIGINNAEQVETELKTILVECYHPRSACYCFI